MALTQEQRSYADERIAAILGRIGVPPKAPEPARILAQRNDGHDAENTRTAATNTTSEDAAQRLKATHTTARAAEAVGREAEARMIRELASQGYVIEATRSLRPDETEYIFDNGAALRLERGRDGDARSAHTRGGEARPIEEGAALVREAGPPIRSALPDAPTMEDASERLRAAGVEHVVRPVSEQRPDENEIAIGVGRVIYQTRDGSWKRLVRDEEGRSTIERKDLAELVRGESRRAGLAQSASAEVQTRTTEPVQEMQPTQERTR